MKDCQLAAPYSGADVFVFPSKYEGFGMPVLEARACGTRIVTSDSPELREAGGDDAVYVKPTEQDLAEGILKAIGSPPPKPLASRDYSWAKGASTMVEVFRGLASSRHGPNESGAKYRTAAESAT